MESLRQALIAIYVALAEAAGGDPVLRKANAAIKAALAAGAIDDPCARRLLRSVSYDAEDDFAADPVREFIAFAEQIAA